MGGGEVDGGGVVVFVEGGKEGGEDGGGDVGEGGADVVDWEREAVG